MLWFGLPWSGWEVTTHIPQHTTGFRCFQVMIVRALGRGVQYGPSFKIPPPEPAKSFCVVTLGYNPPRII